MRFDIFFTFSIKVVDWIININGLVRCVFQVLYCDACRESCHPKRGPLAAHNLGPPRGSWQSNGLKGPRGMGPDGTPICSDHNGEAVSLYCALCKIAACSLCLRDRHAAHPHDVLPLAAACKAQKVRHTLSLFVTCYEWYPTKHSIFIIIIIIIIIIKLHLWIHERIAWLVNENIN